MTYPAPIIAPYDEWFSEPILTETQMDTIFDLQTSQKVLEFD